MRSKRLDNMRRTRHGRKRELEDVETSGEPAADRGESGGARPAGEEGDVGTVISASRGTCSVLFRGAVITCRLAKQIALVQKQALAVGDEVIVALDPEPLVRSVLPRRSILSRPDPHNPRIERLVAANVDLVVHVQSVVAPPLRPRLIDRYLIATQRGGAAPAICVNKIDLVPAEFREAALEPLDVYREGGVPVVTSSTQSREGLVELRRLVAGRTAVLVGHSGVGKSSLLNALDEQLQIDTGGLDKFGRGRHTTRSSTLYTFPDGTRLIDTPGVREFGMWKIGVDELRDYFPEFAGRSDGCRFNDCSHTHEPVCGVREAAEQGEISMARYETYLRLATEVDIEPEY